MTENHINTLLLKSPRDLLHRFIFCGEVFLARYNISSRACQFSNKRQSVEITVSLAI